MLLSVAIKNFWCRFLCPYGALLGVLGWLSPLKITRNKDACIDCELCTRKCPPASKAQNLQSVERRVHELPALRSGMPGEGYARRAVARKRQTERPDMGPGTVVAGVFAAVTGLAMLTGHWQNTITREEYQRRFRQLESPSISTFAVRCRSMAQMTDTEKVASFYNAIAPDYDAMTGFEKRFVRSGRSSDSLSSNTA